MRLKDMAALISIYTGGSMDLERLRGPAMKFARTVILRELCGDCKDCGINALYGALYDLYEIDGTCVADMNTRLVAALKLERE